MRINSLSSLIYNPFWTSKLLHYFLSGATNSVNKKIRLEIIYLALPMIYDDKIFEKLKSSTSRSSFNSIFFDEVIRNSLIEIDKKIDSFFDISNRSLIIIGGKIEVYNDGYISVSDTVDYKASKGPLRDYYKASFNLGLILAKENTREILLRIGASS